MVHLLRSNGSRAPVTLSLLSHDDGEQIQHVVRVAPSTEAARLDAQRMVMTIDKEGRVANVATGPTKALFGFNPQVCAGILGAERECILSAGRLAC